MKYAYAALLCAALLAAAPVRAEDANDDATAVQDINPRYVLVDSRGRTISNEDFPGRFQLITFGYTYCPDICPTTLATMTLVLGQLGEQAARLQPIFISVDPERDSAAVIARYTNYFDARIIGLSGSPQLVRGAADHFKVSYQKYAEPGAAPGSYSVDHSTGIYLLGPDGNFVTKFAHATPASEIAARIATIMATSASPRAGARR